MSFPNTFRRSASASPNSSSSRDRRPSLLTQAHFEHKRALRQQQRAPPPLAMLNFNENFVASTDCKCPSCRMQTKYGPHVLCENRIKQTAKRQEPLETLSETVYTPSSKQADKKEKRKSPVGEAASKLVHGIKRRLSSSSKEPPQSGRMLLREASQRPEQPEVVYSPSEVSPAVLTHFQPESGPAQRQPSYAELVFHAKALLSDFDVSAMYPLDDSPRDSAITDIRDSRVSRERERIASDLDAELEETTRRLQEIDLAYGGEEDEEEYPLHFEHSPLSRIYF